MLESVSTPLKLEQSFLSGNVAFEFQEFWTIRYRHTQSFPHPSNEVTRFFYDLVPNLVEKESVDQYLYCGTNFWENFNPFTTSVKLLGK